MRVSVKLRVIGMFLAICILAGQFSIVKVNAAQGVEMAPPGTKLSGFRITELDKPVANNFKKAVLALNGYAQTLLTNIGEEVNGV